MWVHVAPGRTLALVSGKQQLLAFDLMLASILNNVVRVVIDQLEARAPSTSSLAAGLGVSWGPLLMSTVTSGYSSDVTVTVTTVLQESQARASRMSAHGLLPLPGRTIGQYYT